MTNPTPAEDESRPVEFSDKDEHDGCDHGPNVTHSPNMRIRVTV